MIECIRVVNIIKLQSNLLRKAMNEVQREKL